MDDFLSKFFPDVYLKSHLLAGENTNEYCKFDSQKLTSFTSSLYLAGLVASFVASTVTRKFGRKPSMLAGGLSFLVGAALNGGAENIAMLIIGRILLGVGVGFANQVFAQQRTVLFAYQNFPAFSHYTVPFVLNAIVSSLFSSVSPSFIVCSPLPV